MVNTCYCVGPQNNQPLCPCKMQTVIIENGRYIQPAIDLGPVFKSKTTGTPTSLQQWATGLFYGTNSDGKS